jgi:glycosyltransferase involved in cell wall biosynthesis
LIFFNEKDRDFFVWGKLADSQKSVVIPGTGIDTRHFAPAVARPRQPGQFIFLYLGRMLYDKGLRELAEATRLVKKQIPGLECRLLGFVKADNPSAIPKPVQDGWITDGTFRYLGEAADVRPFIADADVIVLPSYREGLSRSLLEALSMGKPLLATDVPGCSEVVEEGKNGFLAKPRDARSLAQAMLKMSNLPAEELALFGKRSRDLALEKFDDRKVLNAYLSLLQFELQTADNHHITSGKPALP